MTCTIPRAQSTDTKVPSFRRRVAAEAAQLTGVFHAGEAQRVGVLRGGGVALRHGLGLGGGQGALGVQQAVFQGEDGFGNGPLHILLRPGGDRSGVGTAAQVGRGDDAVPVVDGQMVQHDGGLFPGDRRLGQEQALVVACGDARLGAPEDRGVVGVTGGHVGKELARGCGRAARFLPEDPGKGAAGQSGVAAGGGQGPAGDQQSGAQPYGQNALGDLFHGNAPPRSFG